MLYQTDNQHGGDIYGGGITLDYSANTNPLGTPPGVLQAITRALPQVDRYPDPYCRRLVRAIAAFEQVPEHFILCGNGAADLIYAYCSAVNPRTAVELAPTFAEYSLGLERTGCRMERYILRAENDFDPDEVITYVRKSGGEIIKRKGATFYGVANSVVDVCEALMGAQDLVTVVSSMMHGEYGVDDVCTSCLTVIGPNGVKGKIEATLTDEEVAKFKASAEALKAVIKEMDIE